MSTLKSKVDDDADSNRIGTKNNLCPLLPLVRGNKISLVDLDLLIL